MSSSEGSGPLLLFLLKHRKLSELIRICLSERFSTSILQEYFQGDEQIVVKKKSNEFSSASVNNFSFQEIIEIKGSTRKLPKYCENTRLFEMLRCKLSHQVHLTHPERRSVWTQFTQMYQLQGLYENLQEFELPAKSHEDIQKDIQRTYLSGSHGTQSEMRDSIREVLLRFTAYNPYIGYCQGMNFIAAFLYSQKLNREESFFMLKRVTEVVLPCNFYCSMDSTLTLMYILFEVMAYTHPRIYSLIKSLMAQTELSYVSFLAFQFQSFICLFTHSKVDPSIAAIIWDYLLMDGITVLFKAALACFDHLKDYILKCASFEEYNLVVERELPNFNSKQILTSRLKSTYLNEHILFLLKEELTPSSKPHQPKKLFTKECNRKWNTCLQNAHTTNNSANCESFVFKWKDDLNLSENYLTLNKNKYFHHNVTGKESDRCRVGRMTHTCERTSQTFTEASSESSKNKRRSKESSAQKSLHSTPILASNHKFEEGELKDTIKQSIREKIVLQMQEVERQTNDNRESIKERSDSVLFMRSMVEQDSISNVLQLLEEDDKGEWKQPVAEFLEEDDTPPALFRKVKHQHSRDH